MILCALWFGLGAVCGWLGTLSMQWSIERLDPADGAAVAGWVGLGMMLRLTAAAALLLIALRMEAPYGLSAFAGHLLAGRLALARSMGRR
jgi:cbb3-type cytochrome oxidase subunit 1